MMIEVSINAFWSNSSFNLFLKAKLKIIGREVFFQLLVFDIFIKGIHIQKYGGAFLPVFHPAQLGARLVLLIGRSKQVNTCNN